MGSRLKGWEARFARYVESHRDRPFEYGVNDCVTSAAAAIEAIHGVDPMEPFRDRYHDRKSALRLVADFGGLLPLARACGCFEEVPSAYVRRGDVVIVEDARGRDTFKTCLGSDYCGPGKSGLSFCQAPVIKHCLSYAASYPRHHRRR